MILITLALALRFSRWNGTIITQVSDQFQQHLDGNADNVQISLRDDWDSCY